jgi:hypothetical protein
VSWEDERKAQRIAGPVEKDQRCQAPTERCRDKAKARAALDAQVERSGDSRSSIVDRLVLDASRAWEDVG